MQTGQSAYAVPCPKSAYNGHQNLTMEQCKRVAWSEESHFLLHHMDGRVHVHYLPVAKMVPGFSIERRRAGRGSVILRAVFCWENLGAGIQVDLPDIPSWQQYFLMCVCVCV